jgi:hypothetical protein
MGQYNLPQSFHELTATEDIPKSYQDKIDAFQKKGAITNFMNCIKSIGEMR